MGVRQTTCESGRVNIIEITDADDARLSDYRDLTDVALRRVLEPEGGLYIAESTKVIGRALAEGWNVPFVELNRGVEALAGCTLSEIHSLYGPAAYRRYEKRALEDAIQRYPRAVIATPGGIVSDPATFNLLLAHCYTVWVRATPEEHMGRVLAQGDTRPMAGHAGNAEAMNDLRRILESRAAYYSKADAVFDTSEMSPEAALEALREQLRELAGLLRVIRIFAVGLQRHQRGAEFAFIAVVVEKTFEGGREFMAKNGYAMPIESLVTISSMDDGQIIFGD